MAVRTSEGISVLLRQKITRHRNNPRRINVVNYPIAIIELIVDVIVYFSHGFGSVVHQRS